MKLQASLAVAIALTSLNLHAELVSSDWKTPSDNQLVIDTDTGLAWLNMTHTALQSYDDVLAKMVEGGEFENWRFATRDEVGLLFDHGTLGYQDARGTTYTGTDNGLDLLYRNWVNERSNYGMVADKNTRYFYLFGSIDNDTSPDDPEKLYYINYYNSGWSRGASNSNYGHYLVADASVFSAVSASLPGTLGVFALGMAGFVARRKA